ncbi:MAG TPA: energy transducer TonB [Acidobacteriaceae bacterium]|nr:energy transducer TonB [Acidobacteriaceae bacterium]
MTAHAHVVDDEPVAPSSADAVDSGRPIREFEAICAKHNLACGAPANLTAFLAALMDNKLLAMNFWSVVARLSDGRHGPVLSQEQILAAIVQAVTGQGKDKIASAQQESIAQLGRMLAGEDIGTPHPPVAPEELPAATAPQEPPSASEEAPRNDRHSRVTQLHLNTAERAVDPPPEMAPPSSTRSSIRSRLVLTPDLSRPHAETSLPPLSHRNTPILTDHDPETDEPRISIPLSAYADQDDARSPARRLSAVLLALVLLGGAALFLLRGVTAWRQPGNTVQQAFASFAQSTTATFHRVRDAIHGPSTAAHTAVNSDPTLPSTSNPEPGPVTPATVAPAAASSAGTTANTSTSDQSGAFTASPPKANAPNAATSPATTTPRYAPSTSRTTSRARAEEDAASADDAARDAALTQVPGNEMRSHLFASRFPIVPDSANADAVSGVVTLHAVITARGTVEHVYAISGPAALRQAAIDAVSGWRYRPYMLNGQPVDVSTTIRVDFSGNL